LAVVVLRLQRTGVERKGCERNRERDDFTEVVTHLISIGADRALALLQPGRCTCHNKGRAPPHTPRPTRNPRPDLPTPKQNMNLDACRAKGSDLSHVNRVPEGKVCAPAHASKKLLLEGVRVCKLAAG